MKITGVCMYIDDLGDRVEWRFKTMVTDSRQLGKKRVRRKYIKAAKKLFKKIKILS